MRGLWKGLVWGTLAMLVTAGGAWAQDVEVYAEGAYTSGDLVVYLYADINGDPVLSAGVKLMYNPAELTVVSAEKNEAVWFMGDDTGTFPYMDPDTSTPGEILYILGKVDLNDPLAGVAGQRVLLGTARFTRATSTVPVANPETFFGISLDLAHPSPFDNFVTTASVVLDGPGVGFPGDTVREAGDANADGAINAGDASQVRDMFFGGLPYVVYADCNGDGSVNAGDASCIRDKFFGTRPR
ncbi:MAG: hypothetical protein Kow0092_39310 [Deferrisomatales bacterium]